MGVWGEGNPQVVSAQRVTRDRDSLWHESSGMTIDLSNAVRYRVVIRYRESVADFDRRAADWPDFIPNPFSRDGDYTLLTEYHYFNDQNGTPVPAFSSC